MILIFTGTELTEKSFLVELNAIWRTFLHTSGYGAAFCQDLFKFFKKCHQESFRIIPTEQYSASYNVSPEHHS